MRNRRDQQWRQQPRGELYCQGVVTDDSDVDGTGAAWEYTDGWSYRVDLAATEPAFAVAAYTLPRLSSWQSPAYHGDAASAAGLELVARQWYGGEDTVIIASS